MKDLVIYGAGGFAREVLQIVLDINDIEPQWNFRGFLVDDDYRDVDEIQGFSVLGGVEWITGRTETRIVVANGTPAYRRDMVARVSAMGAQYFPTLIHPKAWLGRHITVGRGSIICAGVMITTDIVIGSHAVFNVGAIVGHDAAVGDFVTLSPGAILLGNVTVEDEADIGTNCTVIPHVTVGLGSVLGAGAVATADIPPNSLAVGIPAKVIKTLV